jgi:gamma-glutamyltranspeptidase/glutathione hydrolase
MMGDTVYLSAVDKDGNAVSWIQSLYGSFGSGLVEPETGIVLHNRGAGFSLEADHPNEIKPGKRPFHTLMATLITEPEGALGEKRFSMTLGTPGGSGQPQFISQALMEMKVFNKSPQNAVEAPRFRMGRGKALQVESRFSASVLEALGRRGHELSVEDDWTANFGSVAIIQRQPDGAIRTGADMRREATALAW